MLQYQLGLCVFSQLHILQTGFRKKSDVQILVNLPIIFVNLVKRVRKLILDIYLGNVLPLRKNLLGLKCKANNHYFAFILQVLYIGKQFATANSLFINFFSDSNSDINNDPSFSVLDLTHLINNGRPQPHPPEAVMHLRRAISSEVVGWRAFWKDSSMRRRLEASSWRILRKWTTK